MENFYDATSVIFVYFDVSLKNKSSCCSSSDPGMTQLQMWSLVFVRSLYKHFKACGDNGKPQPNKIKTEGWKLSQLFQPPSTLKIWLESAVMCVWAVRARKHITYRNHSAVGTSYLVLRMTQPFVRFINEELKKPWKTSLKFCISPQPGLEETELWVTMAEKSGPPCTTDLSPKTSWAEAELKSFGWKNITQTAKL